MLECLVTLSFPFHQATSSQTIPLLVQALPVAAVTPHVPVAYVGDVIDMICVVSIGDGSDVAADDVMVRWFKDDVEIDQIGWF